MTYIKVTWNDKNATFCCVLNCFYFVLWSSLAAERSVQNYEKWSFFSIFSRLDPLSHVFVQVKGWLILKLHEMIRVAHLMAFLRVFNLLYAQTYEKLSFFSIFCRLVPFFQVFVQFKEWLMFKLPKKNKNVTYSCVPNCFYFVLWVRLAGKSVQSYEKESFFTVFSRLGFFLQVFGQVSE